MSTTVAPRAIGAAATGAAAARIVTLAGDGIGPEIMAAGLRVLAAATRPEFPHTVEPHPFGGDGIDRTGVPLPDDTLNACRAADAVLLAAIGGPRWDDAPVRPEAGLLRLRSELGLFANLRPTRVTAARAAHSPLRSEIVAGTDFVIVRELTGGIYFGEPRHLGDDEAYDTMRYRRSEIERIARVAFDLARTRRRHVTLVDKANVLATSKLWRQVVAEVAAGYPDVDYDAAYVDATAMKFVSDPTRFDVILTENLFGDILSDEAAEITGSLGTIPSRSTGASGPSLYEPIHGSAPDLAGTGRADPISMISSVSLMLRDSFGRGQTADRIDAAVDAAVAAGEVTPDLGGALTTTQAADAVIRHFERTQNHD
jgi:3-isopropylmalate dehydrogenase